METIRIIGVGVILGLYKSSGLGFRCWFSVQGFGV